MTRATDLIAAERQRQIEVEGWTAEHDMEHLSGNLAKAGVCYVLSYVRQTYRCSLTWPWSDRWWKPTPDDPVRQLVKAGALIAAEIDRLLERSEPNE